WPVWLEKATVLSDQVSQPRRCSGNRAAVLPTLPQATQDCTESTVGMSGHIPIHAVEDILDVEEDDDAADAEETDPGGMHRTTLPGVSEEQPGEPDDHEQRDHQRQILHVVDKQKGAPTRCPAVQLMLKPQKTERN